MCEQKGGDTDNTQKKEKRWWLEGILSATGSRGRDIDTRTGEAGGGHQVKEEAFGSLLDLISEPN